MQDQNDNMTETRGSLEEKTSIWITLKEIVCPCFTTKPESASKDKDSELQPTDKAESGNMKGYNLARGGQQNPTKNTGQRRASEDVTDYDTKKEGLLDKKAKKQRGEHRETLDLQMGTGLSDHKGDSFSCSVSNYPQNELVSIGINESHILARIQKVQLRPNLTYIKNELTQSPKKKKENNETALLSAQFEKFWNQRYLIFEKFDEGVKLDKGSWSTTPPEQVSEFIAGKCAGAKVILDAFAGAGGPSIKLANVNSCIKVIANDWSGSKLSCLLNNAKVYQVESNIEISEQDFLAVDKKGIDVVFAQPPIHNHCIPSKCLSIVDFVPTLNKVITKCLKLAADVLLLLPPQTSIQALCSCLNKCAIQLKKMKGSCSITIDKIYFQNNFKYILISLGGIVQKEVKLNDELEYVYGRLKRKGDTTFRHKKVIKKIRQDHGMLELLNALKSSQKRAKEIQDKSGVLGKSVDLMQTFFDFIREKKLISAQKLQKLMEQQTPDAKKRPSLITSSINTAIQRSKQEKQLNLQAVMQQQKIEQNDIPYRQSQQTQSDYSHYSYLSGLDKAISQGSRHMRLQSDSYSSVIIKRTLNGSRQKRDISSRRDLSPNGSPLTPTRKHGKNRISQMPQKKEMAEGKTRARDL